MLNWDRARILLCLFAVLAQVSCRPGLQAEPGEKTSLTLFAAASLAEPFEVIVEEFETTHPDVAVTLVLAGSQSLAQQILAGAKPDVFASANQEQMEVVTRTGLIDPGEVVFFTRNRLVMIVPKDNPARLEGLKDLAKPGIRLVLAAEEVPVGQYTLQFLAKSTADPEFSPVFKEDVLENTVSYESDVKAVLAKVSLGEGDAGIVYASDASGTAGANVMRLEIPDHLNITARYPAAPLTGSGNPDLARDLIAFVLSDQGQAVLAKYGFSPLEQ